MATGREVSKVTDESRQVAPKAVSGEPPLQGWKEIAAYLDRDARTARRWELEAALPVRRHGGEHGSVYAYPSELDAWRAARKPKTAEPEPSHPRRRYVPVLAGGLALAALAAAILRGPILNPPDPLAEAANAGDGVSAKQAWTIPGRSNFQGSISPDGRHFYTSKGPKNNLLARNLITSEEQSLTNNSPGEYSLHPMVSPGGNKIAYVRWTENEIPQLRVMRLDQSDPVVLVNDEEIPGLAPTGWSPDGRRILAVLSRRDDNYQIALVSAEDGTVQVLKSLEWRYPLKMSFSPNGKFIAYDLPAETNNPNRDIYILHADGSRETPVVRHPSHDRFPVWTPDGKNLLFTSDRTGTTGYWMIPVAEGRAVGPAQLVKADTGFVRAIGFTADGAYYHSKATVLEDVYIATLDPVTGSVQGEPVLASSSFRGANTLPEWSPDGKQLAYFSRRGLWHRGAISGVIVVRSIEDGNERELPLDVDVLTDTRLRWSPDARLLLFGGRRERQQGLYQMDLRTGEISAVVVSTIRRERWHGAWALDGKTIFYIRDEQGESCEIRVRELEGGQEKVLYKPTSSAHLSNLVLSPDGQKLAFGSAEVEHEDPRFASRTLMVMPVTGGKPRTVLDLDPESQGRYFYSLAWTRDGRHLLFSRHVAAPEVPSELWRLPLAGGEAQKIGLPVWGRGSLSTHPDGRRVAFTYRGGEVSLWVMENFLPEMRAAK